MNLQKWNDIQSEWWKRYMSTFCFLWYIDTNSDFTLSQRFSWIMSSIGGILLMPLCGKFILDYPRAGLKGRIQGHTFCNVKLNNFFWISVISSQCFIAYLYLPHVARKMNYYLTVIFIRSRNRKYMFSSKPLSRISRTWRPCLRIIF